MNEALTMDNTTKKYITPLSLASIIFAVIAVGSVLFNKITLYFSYGILQWIPYIFSAAAIVTAVMAIEDGKSRRLLPVISLIMSGWWVIALVVWSIAVAFFHLPPW
jgi:hypothetical protein